MPAAHIQMYLKRAREFLEAMHLLREDFEAYGLSSALLAVHCAISYCDALRIGLGERILSSEDHAKASQALRRLLVGRGYEKLEGVETHTRIVKEKSNMAYGMRWIPISELKALCERTDRFALWAERAGQELKIEGWADE